ncbi:MAG: DUF4114 domain-containing protein [Cyanobacterium sp.]
MALSPQGIPQLIIQEVDIRDGINNIIDQVINQNIIIYVLKIPSLENIRGLQGFIKTDVGENNQVNQNTSQIMGNIPLFPGVYSSATLLDSDVENISLDFQKFINQDDILQTVQWENQRALVTGENNTVNLSSEQIIYDLSWYENLRINNNYFDGQSFTFNDDFLKNLGGNFLYDSIQVAIQDLVIDGNENNIFQNINQTVSTFLFVEEDFIFEEKDFKDLAPIQFSFQESFIDSKNNSINQNIDQIIKFNFSFADFSLPIFSQSQGLEITNPNFDLDNFILPIIDNIVPDSDFFQNHEVFANNRSLVLSDIFGNENIDTQSSSQILLLTANGIAPIEEDESNIFIPLSPFFSELQNLVLGENQEEINRDSISNLFNQVFNSFFERNNPNIFIDDNGVFFVSNVPDGLLQFRLFNKPMKVREFGFIAVDDAMGVIDGINPNEESYREKALERKITVFDGQDSADVGALTTQLARDSFSVANVLEAGDMSFFGALNSVSLDNGYYTIYVAQEDDISFGVDVPPTVVSEGKNYHQISWDDLVVEFSANTLVTPGIFNQPTRVNITRGGDFKNTVALFRVDSFDGGIDVNGDSLINVRPGDVDYARIALERAKDDLTGIVLNTPDAIFSTISQEIELEENTTYGFVIIPNATIDDVLTLNPSNDFSDVVGLFSFASSNPGGVSHMAKLGSNLFAFEDMVGGGDLDYNDVILEFIFA